MLLFMGDLTSEDWLLEFPHAGNEQNDGSNDECMIRFIHRRSRNSDFYLHLFHDGVALQDETGIRMIFKAGSPEAEIPER